MMKRSLLIFTIISIVLILGLVYYQNLDSSVQINGEKIYDFLIQRGCNTGYLRFLKYSINGVPYGENRLVKISSEDMTSKILPLIKKIPVSSTTIRRYERWTLTPHTHTITFQNNDFSIIRVEYSSELNQLVFDYANIFPEKSSLSSSNPRIIIVELDESFKEIIMRIQGPDILDN